MNNLIVPVGNAGKIHGLKGAVLLHLLSLNSANTVLDAGLSVVINSRSEKLGEERDTSFNWTIEKVQKIPGKKREGELIVYFKEFTTCDEIEKYLPFELSVLRENFPELNSGEYYYVDLISLPVFDFENPDHKFGDIIDLYSTPAQDIVVIKLLEEGEEPLEIPLVEVFFPVIDVIGKKVLLKRPKEI